MLSCASQESDIDHDFTSPVGPPVTHQILLKEEDSWKMKTSNALLETNGIPLFIPP